jgi:hypothetical protein
VEILLLLSVVSPSPRCSDRRQPDRSVLLNKQKKHQRGGNMREMADGGGERIVREAKLVSDVARQR